MWVKTKGARLMKWREKYYTDKGYLYLNADNSYVKGIIGTDIKLTLWQRVQILFCGGISVVLHGR